MLVASESRHSSNKTQIFLVPKYFNYCHDELSERLKKLKLPAKVMKASMEESEDVSLKRAKYFLDKVSFDIMEKAHFSLPASKKSHETIYRFYELKTCLKHLIENEEQKKVFKTFVSIHDNIHSCELITDEIISLQSEISSRTHHYFETINILLNQGIKRALNMIHFAGLLKSSTKILVVDDFPQTMKALIDFGFRKKNLLTMNVGEFMKKYSPYKQEQSQKKMRSSIGKFLATGEEFKTYDIIYLNFWRESKDTVPVHLSIKQEKILGAEEESLLKKKPKILAEEKQQLNKEKQQLNKELKEVERTLKLVESKKQEMKEGDYLRVQKNRKKILSRIKKVDDIFKKILKPKAKTKEFIFLNIDMIDVLKDAQSWKGKVKDIFSAWKISDKITKKFFKDDKILSATSLLKLCGFVNQKKKLQSKYQEKCDKVATFKEKIENVAKSDGYLKGNEKLENKVKEDLLNILEATIIFRSYKK